MVMENTRTAHYGNYCQRKKQIQFQLEALTRVLNADTGFGSYAMENNYLESSGSFCPQFMIEDVDLALSHEFQSEIVVPFSAKQIVYDDHYTDQNPHPSLPNGTYSNVADQIWCRLRFEKLWVPVTNLTCRTNADQTVTLDWSWPEQAKSFQVAFSTDPSFSATNAAYACASNRFDSSDGSLPTGLPLYWKARGTYEVLYIATNGLVVATNTYYGAWSRSHPDSFSIPP